MKIIEVRDGFIVFEAGKDICLSSFVKIDGADKSYIAQITQLKIFGEISIASAKILFLYKDNALTAYDNTLPSKDSNIESFTQDILSNSVKSKKPVIIGKTTDNSSNIVIDFSAFNKKMLISVDSQDLNNILVRNLTKQFEHLGVNTIVLDTLGVIKSKKYTAGVDFKLPLDTETLSFMYDSCLSDATSDSKSTIVEIFQELSDYSKSVPFVPFKTLKSIVDNMVDNQHVFKLLVLKNKLAKFEKLGYFATDKKEVDNLENILSANNVVIDLSRLDQLFLNRYLSYIYEKIQKLENIQVLMETSNTVSKKSLKFVLTESEVPTAIITHSKFQYLNDMKNMFDNFILEPSLTNKKVFDIYSSFLNPVKQGIYLSSGEALNYIPLLSNAQMIDEFVEYVPEPEPEPISEAEQESAPIITEDETTAENAPESAEEDLTEDNAEETVSEDITEEELNSGETISDELTEEDLSEDTLEEGITEEELNNEETITEEITEEDLNSEEPLSEEITGEALTEDITEEVEVVEPEIITEEENNEEPSEEDETPSMTQEEIYSAIEEKSETVLSSVAENFDGDERLNLFDEGGEIIEETPQEEIFEAQEDISATVNETDLEASNEANLSENDLEESLNTELEEEIEFNQTGDMEILQSEEDLAISQEDFEKESSVLKEIEAGYGNEEEVKTEEDEQQNEEIEVDEDVDSMINDAEEEELEEPDYDKLGSHLDIDLSAEPQILPLSGEEYTQDFDEIVELNPDEADANDIVVDMTDDDTLLVDENTEQEIIDAVDKVYTTPPKENNEEEEISDSDLDLIDELNNENNEELDSLEENNYEELSDNDEDGGLLEEFNGDDNNMALDNDDDNNEILEHRSSSTPIVPVYEADIPEEDMVVSDPIQQGDAVRHAKYGNGVVEKMIKYGSKTLFAINFENLGRRLLDPTLTEIKRI